MLENTQIIILELLKLSIFNTQTFVIDFVDWSFLIQESQFQTVVGLINPVIKEYAEDHDVPNLDQWTDISDQLQAYFVWSLQTQSELVKVFADNDIPMVILKGNAAAVYYPVPQYRTMGDIDFLVPKDRYVEAQDLMSKSGYQIEYGVDHDESRHIGYTKNGVLFEMHQSFSSYGVDIEPELEYGLMHPDTGTIAGVSFPMLSPLENGLVLLMHIRQHLLEEVYSLGLRQIIDWMMYVNRYSGSELESGEVWDDAFMSLAQKYGLDNLAITVTYTCKTWIGLPNYPVWCEKADHATAEELLEMIMASGNFGNKLGKDNRDIKEGVILYKHEGFFKRLQNRGLANWKAAQKHRVLRPFAWIYQGFRVMGLGIKALFIGKNGIKQINAGNRKSDLLKRLGV